MNDLNDRLSENLSQKVFFGRDVDLTAHETEDRLMDHDASKGGILFSRNSSHLNLNSINYINSKIGTKVFLRWANPSSFSFIFVFSYKLSSQHGNRTRIVGVESKDADH